MIRLNYAKPHGVSTNSVVVGKCVLLQIYKCSKTGIKTSIYKYERFFKKKIKIKNALKLQIYYKFL